MGTLSSKSAAIRSDNGGESLLSYLSSTNTRGNYGSAGGAEISRVAEWELLSVGCGGTPRSTFDIHTIAS